MLASPLGIFGTEMLKGLTGTALGQEFYIGVVIVDIHNVFLGKDWLELLGQEFSVFCADAVDGHGSDVAEYSVLYLFIELFDELMGDVERQFVLARFGQNGGDRIGGNILELVNV